jgi:hypothetical protein
MGGGGVKKYPKLRDVIYERPPVQRFWKHKRGLFSNDLYQILMKVFALFPNLHRLFLIISSESKKQKCFLGVEILLNTTDLDLY